MSRGSPRRCRCGAMLACTLAGSRPGRLLQWPGDQRSGSLRRLDLLVRIRSAGDIASSTPVVTGAALRQREMSVAVPKELLTMSAVEEALLINAIVLIAVLQADLGPHRTITLWRILRPILLMCVIVPIYLMSPARHGIGLTLELAATAIGIVLGLAVSMLMTVYRSPRTGRPVSRAGVAYAAVWIVVIGARSAFSYGAATLVQPTTWHLDGPAPGHRERPHRRHLAHGRRHGRHPHPEPRRASERVDGPQASTRAGLSGNPSPQRVRRGSAVGQDSRLTRQKASAPRSSAPTTMTPASRHCSAQ